MKVNGGNGADEDTIPANSFKGCGIQLVILSENIKTIGNNAFENCASLKNAYITGVVSSIGDYAFKGCTELAKFESSGSWFFKGTATHGNGAPDSGYGNWSDYYYDESTDKLYCKYESFGDWYALYDFIHGNTAPTEEQGLMRETYVDFSTYKVYQKDSLLTSIGALMLLQTVKT